MTSASWKKNQKKKKEEEEEEEEEEEAVEEEVELIRSERASAHLLAGRIRSSPSKFPPIQST